ncbi:unnamed protein product, partial [Discosporangium mesarthrocarpum]
RVEELEGRIVEMAQNRQVMLELVDEYRHRTSEAEEAVKAEREHTDGLLEMLKAKEEDVKRLRAELDTLRSRLAEVTSRANSGHPGKKMPAGGRPQEVGEGQDETPETEASQASQPPTPTFMGSAESAGDKEQVAASISSHRRRSTMIPRAKQSLIPTSTRSKDPRRFGDITNSQTAPERRAISSTPPPCAFKPSPASAGHRGTLTGTARGRLALGPLDEAGGAGSSIARRTRSRISLAP